MESEDHENKKRSHQKRALYQVFFQNRIVCSFPTIFTEDSSSLVFGGQPREICCLIGTFLTPKEAARAMEVCKAWYLAFREDSIWLSFLPASMSPQYPLKVEVALQELRKRCWMENILEKKKVKLPITKLQRLRGGIMAPTGKWVLLYGEIGSVYYWTVGSPIKKFIQLGGSSDDPHKSQHIFGGIVSPDGEYAITFGYEGYVIKWKGFESQHISGTRIAGTDMSLNPHLSMPVLGGAMGPNGKWGLTVGSGGRVVHWIELDSDCPVANVLSSEEICSEWNNYMFRGATISSDGSWALTVGLPGLVVLWRGFSQNQIVPSILKNPHLSFVSNSVISPDGSWGLSAGGGGRIVRWSELSSNSPSPTLIAGKGCPSNPHSSEWISKVVLSPDGSWAITVDLEHRILIWKNTPLNTTLRNTLLSTSEPQMRHNDEVDFLLSPDASWAIVITSRNQIQHISCKISVKKKTISLQ